MDRRADLARQVARWFARHGGIMTTRDIDSLGLTRAQVRRLVRAEMIVPRLPGVYCDPHRADGPELTTRAAVAHGGPGALASHHSAAWLLGLQLAPPPRPQIMVPRSRRVRVPGVVARHGDVISERGTVVGIPVTTASRTLVDLAGLPATGTTQLCRAIDQALTSELTAVAKLLDLTEPGPGRRRRPGQLRLRSILVTRGYVGADDQSALERRMGVLIDDLCRDHGLPEPVREHPVFGGRYRLDFAWPVCWLAVEVDGYGWHSSPEAMGRDRHRRNELVAAGWTVLAFTWQQVERQPHEVGRQIALTHESRRRLAGAPTPAV